VVNLRCRNFLIPTCIYISTYESYVGSSSALLRFIGSVGNLSLLTTGDYYYHESHNKNGGKKMVTR
jgi:hypothetical protein